MTRAVRLLLGCAPLAGAYLAPSKTLGIVRTGANQLGKVQVRDLAPRLLCVPTHKFEPNPKG
ncbi:MAG TPA: hypothetical protein VHT53_02065 [Candidatus Elarobacter sp.]|jgi:hypothetical protein|nr:hypothetical protein [Candidatus Elarobacter sp.]